MNITKLSMALSIIDMATLGGSLPLTVPVKIIAGVYMYKNSDGIKIEDDGTVSVKRVKKVKKSA